MIESTVHSTDTACAILHSEQGFKLTANHKMPETPVELPNQNILKARLLLEYFGVKFEGEKILIDTYPIPRPLRTGFMLLNRYDFDKPAIDMLVDRSPFLAEFARAIFSSADKNFMFCAATPSGYGKSHSIGLLMELTFGLFNGGPHADHAREYLKRELGEKWGSKLADYLSDCVVLPLAFNHLQIMWEVEKHPNVSCFSRLLENIVESLRDKKVGMYACRGVIEKVFPNNDFNIEFVYTVLDLLFQREGGRKVKYIFAVDGVMGIPDASLRIRILDYVCSLMDARPSLSHVYAVSYGLEVFFDFSNSTKRPLHFLPLTRCPSLITRHDRLKKAVRKNPVCLPFLFDMCANPRQLKHSIWESCLYKRLVEGSYGKIISHNGGPLLYGVHTLSSITSQTIKVVVKALLDGNPIHYNTVIGHFDIDRKEPRDVKICDLFTNGLLSPLGFKGAVSPSDALKWEFVPEALGPVMVFWLTECKVSNSRWDSKLAVNRPCAAFWALALCLVNPCTSDGQKLFFAVNELLRRMRAYHGDDYFTHYDDKEPAESREATMGHVHDRLDTKSPIHNLPVTLHPHCRLAFVPESSERVNLKHRLVKSTKKSPVGALINDIYDLLKYDYDSTVMDRQFLPFEFQKSDTTLENTEGVLSQITDENFKTFCEGGILLMNLPKGPGYDFVIGDGKCLSFYNVIDFMVSHTAKETGTNTYLPNALNINYDDCKAEFEKIYSRVGNVFTDWRLIILSFHDVPDYGIKDNTFIVGPQAIAQMFPPTFLTRLEFSKYESECEMLENYKLNIKLAAQKELESLDVEEREVETDSETLEIREHPRQTKIN